MHLHIVAIASIFAVIKASTIPPIEATTVGIPIVTDGMPQPSTGDPMVTEMNTHNPTTEGTVSQIITDMVTDTIINTVVTDTIIGSATNVNIAAMTTPIIGITIQAHTDIVPVQCTSGFVQCRDGRCEPFESLCEEVGVVTIATKAPVTRATSVMPPMITNVRIETSSANAVVSTGMITGSVTNMATVMVTNIDPVTGMNGVCATGWVKCADGRCEPFEQLCGEGGIVTLPTVTRVTTLPTTTDANTMTNTTSVTMVTTPTGTPASTLPTTHVTLPALDNGCPPGHERCLDATCEPFHFMCEEHVSGEIIGR